MAHNQSNPHYDITESNMEFIKAYSIGYNYESITMVLYAVAGLLL